VLCSAKHPWRDSEICTTKDSAQWKNTAKGLPLQFPCTKHNICDTSDSSASIPRKVFRTASCSIELSSVKIYRRCQPFHALIVYVALLNASEFSRSTTQCSLGIAIPCSSHTRKENILCFHLFILWVESNCVRYPRWHRISRRDGCANTRHQWSSFSKSRTENSSNSQPWDVKRTRALSISVRKSVPFRINRLSLRIPHFALIISCLFKS